jgi:hypothetical protein
MRFALVGLFLSGLTGCLAEVADEESSPKGEDTNPFKRTSALVTAASNEFESFSYQTVNGNAATERYAECGTDQVLTGVGARAYSGDVRDITVHCRDILPDGTLSQQETTYSNGGPSEEKLINANPGSVVVGLGGVITGGSNFGRLTAKQCEWDPQTRTIKPQTCGWISTDTSLSVELQLDLHARFNSTERFRIVGAGAGFTESNLNLAEIRMRVGKLRNATLFDQSPIAGGQKFFTVTVPLGARSVHFRTTSVGSQIGDADLYVRKNAQVTLSTFDCRSWSATNAETCDFDSTDASGTYYLLLNNFADYQNVRLTVTYATTY